MAPYPSRLSPGSPYPLGATWDGLGTNFAVFSAHAERMDLCLFDPSGKRQIRTYQLPECTDEVWHGYLPNARAGLLYGYRAYGPYDPHNGDRFNNYKLLLDPYARRMAGDFRWSDALFGYRVNSSRADLSFDRRDSAPGMFKAVVTDESFNWADDRPPNVPWADTIIYEVHLRGLSMLRENLRPNERGTFAALAEPDFIAHLKRLGITAVELLPVHAYLQDRYLLEKGLSNYWGYNTLGFFAIEPRYLSENSANEMRVAVRRLHAAGIEVILDVVYNHTGEGSEMGPTLSFRGLDNASYYRLVPDNKRHCINDTGTGNTVNLSHARVLQMIMDSLRYCVTQFHVDGFRDTVRRFWRGDAGQRSDLAARLAGSSDLFDRRSRRPWASVNFISCHDGYTLTDVVSYIERHNEANGEDNRDGHGENYSANWGIEGPSDDPAILDARRRVARAMLAT